jgi:hypothetical protein
MLQGYQNALTWVNIGYCAARWSLSNSENVVLEDIDCKKGTHADGKIW